MGLTKKSKNNGKQHKRHKHKKQLDMYSYLYYGMIVSLTLFAFIISINIQEVSVDPLTLTSMNINVSLSNIKVLGHIIVLVCYSTLVQYPISKIFHKEILLKIPPKGDRGIRGDRGKAGISGKCEVCSDDLCYKKILYSITNTYNLWRLIKGKSFLPKSYIIKNEFLKDKIKKHCGSKEFKAILTKHGSNNPTNKGIYDYLFKMWSMWILILLKYDKGEFFITSENLSEQDFNGLINENDGFADGDILNHDSITLETYPYYKHGTEIKHIKELFKEIDITPTAFTNEKNLSLLWENMTVATKTKTSKNIKYNELIDLKELSETDRNNKIKEEYGIIFEFFDKEGVPGRGKDSPFTEIKKFTAWYWGSDDFTKPDIEIDTQTRAKNNLDNDKNYLIKKECSNYELGKGIFKHKNTNNFYKLWSSDFALQSLSKTDNILTPFKLYGSLIDKDGNTTEKGITILRPHHYIDENAHPKFRTYKPLGDIIIDSEKLKKMPFKTDKCKPGDIKFDRKILTRIVDDTDTPFETILVSGDVKPPIVYLLVFNSQRDIGINSKITAFHIWKPIPPPGYKALGYVIDTRFIKIENILNFRLSTIELDKINKLVETDPLLLQQKLDTIFKIKLNRKNEIYNILLNYKDFNARLTNFKNEVYKYLFLPPALWVLLPEIYSGKTYLPSSYYTIIEDTEKADPFKLDLENIDLENNLFNGSWSVTISGVDDEPMIININNGKIDNNDQHFNMLMSPDKKTLTLTEKSQPLNFNIVSYEFMLQLPYISIKWESDDKKYTLFMKKNIVLCNTNTNTIINNYHKFKIVTNLIDTKTTNPPECVKMSFTKFFGLNIPSFTTQFWKCPKFTQNNINLNKNSDEINCYKDANFTELNYDTDFNSSNKSSMDAKFKEIILNLSITNHLNELVIKFNENEDTKYEYYFLKYLNDIVLDDELKTITDELNKEKTELEAELQVCDDYIKIHNIFYADFINNPFQPSKDLIYCVLDNPNNSCLSTIEKNDSIWETDKYINDALILPITDKLSLYQTIDNLVTIEQQTQLLDYTCGCEGRSDTVFKKNVISVNGKNGGIKDKKYSILDIYN